MQNWQQKSRKSSKSRLLSHIPVSLVKICDFDTILRFFRAKQKILSFSFDDLEDFLDEFLSFSQKSENRNSSIADLVSFL